MESKGGERESAEKQQANNLKHRRRYHMKISKTFLTLAIVGFMAVLLCFPASVFAKGPNPPIIGANEKLIGPSLKGVIIAGWRYNGSSDGSGRRLGNVEAFLYLEGKLYTEIMAVDVPLSPGGDSFEENVAADVPGWPLPCEIVEDYNMGVCGTSQAVVFEEKDVSNFYNEPAENLGIPAPSGYQFYEQIIYCEVKISFLIPK
jgi:hypothetical protein